MANSGSAECTQYPYPLNGTAGSSLCSFCKKASTLVMQPLMPRFWLRNVQKNELHPTHLILSCSSRKVSGVIHKTLQYCIIVITMHAWDINFKLATRYRLQHVLTSDIKLVHCARYASTASNSYYNPSKGT